MGRYGGAHRRNAVLNKPGAARARMIAMEKSCQPVGLERFVEHD